MTDRRRVPALAGLIMFSLNSIAQGGWEEIATPLDAYVGWYGGYGDEPLGRVTWDEDGELLYVDFNVPRVDELALQEGDVFTWDYSSDAQEARIGTFVRDAEGEVEALDWTNGAGESGRLSRRDDAGYDQRQVRFEGGLGTALVGTLMVPRGAGPFPGVVIIQGSGTSSRGNLWAMTIADHLAFHGMGVLFPDKRGSGMSEGDWRGVGFDVLAEDAIAGMGALRGVAGIDPGRTGFVGLSQGGWIAPLAAQRMGDNAFVVDVSGTVLTPGEQVRHEVEQDFRAAGLDDAQVDRLLAVVDLGLEDARSGKKWSEFVAAVEAIARDPLLAPIAGEFKTDSNDPFWRFWRQVIDFDALPIWRELEAPSLFIFGAEDAKDNVPIQATVRPIERLKRDACSGDVTLRVFEGMGHGLMDSESGWVSQEFLELLSDWVRVRTNCD